MRHIIKLLIVSLLVKSFYAECANYTENDSTSFNRAKRWLTYQPGGGQAKLTFGALSTIAFNHYKLVRNIVAIMNVQVNYAIPSSIVWPVPESFFKQRMLSNGGFEDNSRRQLYRVLERMLDSFGTSGRDCVLKAICEIAEAPLVHNGMFGELLDVIFTPYQRDSVAGIYKTARSNGLEGKDCNSLYHRCVAGTGILDRFSFLYKKE